MNRRSFWLIGILLFLILSVSCQKSGEEIRGPAKAAGGTLSHNYNDNTNNQINDGINNGTINGIQNNLDNIPDTAKEGDIELKDNNIISVMGILSTYSGSKLAGVMKAFPAGTRIDTLGVEKNALESLFYYEEISEDVINRINGKSYGEDCTIPYEDLRYIRVLHKGFDGNTYIGELIMNQTLAQDIIEIFRELYDINYPIEKMNLVDEYDADDDKSMAANNSSAFNFRFIAGTTRPSLHGLGIAIDINPLYNPYITKIDGKTAILPENGSEYADRTLDNPYYIRKGDPCYEAFISRGFTWGGDWKNSKDYQHFQRDIEE